jgi:YHS domain-containing protein
MRKVIILVSMLLLAADVKAQNHQKLYNVEDGVGIQGYDPVSYWEGKPQEGSKKLTAATGGVTYYFMNAEHLEKFKKNPTGYEPQYGGWCAYAMGKVGEKVEVDPKTFKILNGKLFLFYNKYLNNTLKSWNKNESYLHKSADANWQKLAQ